MKKEKNWNGEHEVLEGEVKLLCATRHRLKSTFLKTKSHCNTIVILNNNTTFDNINTQHKKKQLKTNSMKFLQC